MSELETRIQESYDRLALRSPVYLVKNERWDYGELPDPESVRRVFKAGVVRIDPEYMSGISVVNWPTFQPPDEDTITGPLFDVSPREVFMLREVRAVLRERVPYSLPRKSKLDSYIKSKRGNFGAALAAEMAGVILERFAEDSRDSSGHLILKR